MPATARIEVTRRHDAEGRLLAAPTIETSQGMSSTICALLEESRVDLGLYADQPVPLLAGAVGYFGYEAGYFIEDMPDLGADDLGMPDVYFMFHDVLLAHCHGTERSFLSVVGGATEDSARQHAKRLRDDMLQRIEAFDAEPPAPEWTGPTPDRAAATHVDVKSHFDLPGYCELVERCKEHIFAGDIFEVCLTHRLETELVGDPWDLYQELRRINPAPFASFLNFPEGHVISSSPERYISLGADRVAESRPIKRDAPPRRDTGRRRSHLSRIVLVRQRPGRKRDDRRPGAQRLRPGLQIRQRARFRADDRRTIRHGFSDGFDHSR